MMGLKRNKKSDSFDELEEKIIASLQNKNVPLLILDEKWLEIFPEHLQSGVIRDMVLELNGLLKKQGRETDELKGMKRYKSQMMQEIVQLMGADDTEIGRLKQKKMDKNQKKILEINEEIHTREDSLSDLPHQIRQMNAELMVESTKVCYERLKANKERLKEIDEEIAQLREKLKRQMLEKQEREMQDGKMYTYLHSILGPKMMEQLDYRLEKENKEE